MAAITFFRSFNKIRFHKVNTDQLIRAAFVTAKDYYSSSSSNQDTTGKIPSKQGSTNTKSVHPVFKEHRMNGNKYELIYLNKQRTILGGNPQFFIRFGLLSMIVVSVNAYRPYFETITFTKLNTLNFDAIPIYVCFLTASLSLIGTIKIFHGSCLAIYKVKEDVKEDTHSHVVVLPKMVGYKAERVPFNLSDVVPIPDAVASHNIVIKGKKLRISSQEFPVLHHYNELMGHN